jgi:putative Holliday junction resolvase
VTTPPRTFLAFDYGSKRIGVAVGQELTRSATALVTLPNRANQNDWNAIDQLVKEWCPAGFVIGLPLNADGSEHQVSHAAKQFGNQLQARYNLPAYWIDERLTSSEAQSMIAAGSVNSKSGQKAGAKSRQGKDQIDSTAAKLILESWFNQQVSRV